MQELTHYIDGAHVKGTSGRFADVFNPATGDVQAKVPLASADELDRAVQIAAKAQPAWAAVNPQRRARVMMKFVNLLNRDMDKLAEALSREHGKTLPDAAGDVVRGLEVVEYCIGAPQMLKGEFTDSAGPGIDMYSMKQALGVTAGITPFNFPAMIPMWMFAPAIACGNAFILKPSERDPSVPLMLAELMEEAGLPKGILQVVNGDKEAVDAILHHDVIQSVGFVGSTPIAEYIYSTGCANGKRVQCFGGAKNHMIIMPDADMNQAADALVGAGYGAAGERCMAISVAVAVGDDTADRLLEKLVPKVEALKVGFQSSIGMLKDGWLTLKRMLLAEVSTKNLGGIISISYVSYSVAEAGLAKLFYFLCLLSVNLAFVNVLPIPLLDGGHLLFLLLEKIKGSPVSERIMGYSQMVGLVLLVGLMVYVTYNDLMRVVFRG